MSFLFSAVAMNNSFRKVTVYKSLPRNGHSAKVGARYPDLPLGIVGKRARSVAEAYDALVLVGRQDRARRYTKSGDCFTRP